MADALEIGYAIKDRRAELGVTQAQLAEAAGVSKRCLWSLELGQNPGAQPASWRTWTGRFPGWPWPSLRPGPWGWNWS